MAENTKDVRIPLGSFSLAEAEKAICKEALRLGGSVAMAARFMKCSEARVRKIMRAHDLTADTTRTDVDATRTAVDDSQAKAEPGGRGFAGATRYLN